MQRRSLHSPLIAALAIASLAPFVAHSSWGPSQLQLHERLGTFARKNEMTTSVTGRERDPTIFRKLLRGTASTAEGGDGMAACLLIKDENHRLAEWIAYHYHALPLHHLVVAVDPTSLTSPSSILDRWRTTVGMEIVEWTDGDFGKRVMTPRPMSRQMEFFPACAAYHKRMNRTWVVFTDVDEYIAFNPSAVDDLDRQGVRFSERKQFVVDTEEDMKDPNFVALREQRMRAREWLPEVGNTTVLDFMTENRDGALWLNDTCLTVPRLLFSAVESTKEILSAARIDKYGFNSANFNTLRFFHHARKGSHKFNKWGKVLVDVSRVPMERLAGRIITNTHKPFDVCKRPEVPYETAFLRCHHYTSTWEAYSFKGDYRKTREEFDKVATISFGVTYDMQPWLSSFVRAVGLRNAHHLLQGTGLGTLKRTSHNSKVIL